MEDEGEEFFASDIIPNAVVTETSTKSKSSTNGQIDDPGPSDPSDASKPVALSTPFTSLKGRVDHNILKALTVKPFQLEAMSEVQKRVLALMPELSGGKPKASAVEVGGGGEGVMQTNVVGQKVSTAARGKHDLLVKAKTGTGKTIVGLQFR
jgi:ATP-dependent RNA helicase MSS116